MTTATTPTAPRFVFEADPGRHETPGVRLSRYGHHTNDPEIQSYVFATGFDDNTGGTVELEAHVHTSGMSLNGRREVVPVSDVLNFGFSLTRGEALALGNALIRAASVTGRDERDPLGALRLPRVGPRELRAPWNGPATCTPACDHAPIVEAVTR